MKLILSDMDKELKTQIDLEIFNLSQLVSSVNDLPHAWISKVPKKDGSYETAVIAPKARSAPSSPQIRRTKLAVKSPSTTQSIPRKLLVLIMRRVSCIRSCHI